MQHKIESPLNRPRFYHALFLSALALSACETIPEEDAGGSSLDPHSPGSRAKLAAAQRAFSTGSGDISDSSMGDLSMRAFDTGGGDLSMNGFRTQDLQLKEFGGTRAFGGMKRFFGGKKDLNLQMSPLSSRVSEVSTNSFAEEGSKSFFGKRYKTKSYQPGGRGVRTPSFPQPKVTSIDSMIDESRAPDSPSESIADIRKLLNR